MDINKNYLLYTKKDTIFAEKIKVNGILNYDKVVEILGGSSDTIKSLYYNEKIVDSSQTINNQELEEILKGLSYYYCTNIENNIKYFVWSDIIDYTRTTKINTVYSVKCNITIGDNISTSLNTILNEIRDYISSNHPTGSVNIQFENTSVESDNELTMYKNKLEEYDTIVSKLLSMKNILPMIDRLSKTDYDKIILLIYENIDIIKTRLETISKYVGS
ncbi:MAG TPA: hypothetical protein PLJ38_02060 [bacterium]|nr:hypothetical protein [bacterium]